MVKTDAEEMGSPAEGEMVPSTEAPTGETGPVTEMITLVDREQGSSSRHSRWTPSS